MNDLSPIGRVIETMFRIVNKEGDVVDFQLNPYQRRLDQNWTRRNIVPKARRLGMSAYIDARFVAKCLGMENRRCTIISHDAESTGMLLDRARFFVENIKGVPAVTGRNSRNELTFPKTNSTLYIGTAGSRNFGRGDTITDLHCSEIAFWSDPIKLVRALFQAAKQGEITVESTGNGVGNWYHRQCLLAESGRGFALHFFNWLEMAENSLPFANDTAKRIFLEALSEDLEEPSLLETLTPEQLHWRRDTIATDFDGDLRSFKAEYPITLAECFQSTGYSFFQRVARYMPTGEWKRENRHLWVLDGHPRPGFAYCIGADVSAGVGRDRSVAQIICCNTNEQVAEYVNDHLAPDTFGIQLASLGRRFNNAPINPERNNHGLTTIAILLQHYPHYLLHRPRREGTADDTLREVTVYGTLTTEMSRDFFLGQLKKSLASHEEPLIIHSESLKSELDTFVETDKGKVEADSGLFDDRVIAIALADMIKGSAARRAAAMEHQSAALEDPFSLDSMLNELEGRASSGFPISRQVEDEKSANTYH